MEHSESIGKLAGALGQFQYSVGVVTKDATNPFFKSRYATLENILEHIKDPLAKNKLTVAQFPDGEGLTTILMHEDGEWMKATMKVHMGAKPQDQGSAITYARRYALSAVLGLATEDDDDGNAASAPKAPQTAKSAPQRTETSEAANREKAKRDRTKWLLGKLGYDMKNPSLADVAEAISKEVSLDLSSDDLDVINEALASKTPKK